MLFAWCAGITTDFCTDGDKIHPSQGKIFFVAGENKFSCYLRTVFLKVGHNVVCVKKGRQCTCNVTFRRLRATNVLAVDKQKLLRILSVFGYTIVMFAQFLSFCMCCPKHLRDHAELNNYEAKNIKYKIKIRLAACKSCILYGIV
jgi:hypothetical protein